MNGFKEHHLDEDAFGPKAGSIVSSFDAFRKSRASSLFKIPPSG